MSVTTIVLADDHPVVRQGLRALLETEPGLQVVGETGNGLEAIQLALRLKPDVLVTDLMMPGLTGLEVARQIRDRVPETRVLVLSMYSTEAYVLEALKNGASGFVMKDCPAADLLNAVSEVAAGRRHLSAALSDRTLDAYIGKAASVPLDAYDSLTTREREVLQLAAEGGSSTDIANRLSISPRTAETHRGHLMRKLGLRTQTDLIRFAIRRGVLLIDA
ncbi:MAG: response regulator [Janthinobacterium lividum]